MSSNLSKSLGREGHSKMNLEPGEALQKAQYWYEKVCAEKMTGDEIFMFNKWLEIPSNAKAYDKFERFDGVISDLAATAEGRLLIRHANAQTQQRSIAGLLLSFKKHFALPQWIWYGVPACIMLLVCMIFIARHIDGEEIQHFATVKGETRSLSLSDGTVLTLSPNSSVSVSYTATSRLLALEFGHAFFDVAKNIDKPFVVTANGYEVHVTGTEFGINTKRHLFELKVAEGSVNVTPEGGKPHQVRSLVAGEKIMADSNSDLGKIEKIKQGELDVWKKGVLVYRDEKLSTILNETNSYTKKSILTNSKAIGDMRVSLSINIQELDELPKILSALLPIEAHESDYQKILLIEKR